MALPGSVLAFRIQNVATSKSPLATLPEDPLRSSVLHRCTASYVFLLATPLTMRTAFVKGTAGSVTSMACHDPVVPSPRSNRSGILSCYLPSRLDEIIRVDKEVGTTELARNAGTPERRTAETQRSSGLNPVRLTTLANIRGPISS